MRRQPRGQVVQATNGHQEAKPLQIPPMPKSKIVQKAGTAQDIPAAIMNQKPEPTPGLSGQLSFFFGGTGEERKEFKFRTPRTGQTGPWRQAVAGPAEDILRVVFEAMATDVETPEGINRIIEIIKGHVLTVPDVLRELVLDFHLDLRAAEAEILDLAFDEEIAEAFLTACKVAFPLASLQSLLKVGAAMRETSSN